MSNSVFLSVISQMVTPAILIMAAGSLVSTTMARLARVTDRARELLRLGREQLSAGDTEELARTTRMLRELQGRSWLSEHSLIASYSAIGMFLGCVLSIALTDLLHIWYWLPILFAMAGGAMLFASTAMLMLEAQRATGGLRSEILDYNLDVVESTAPLRASR